MTAFGKEFGTLAQGDNKTGARIINSLFVMDPADIRNIPKDRVIAYGRIVPDYREQKEDPNQVRITAGGTFINYQLSRRANHEDSRPDYVKDIMEQRPQLQRGQIHVSGHQEFLSVHTHGKI